MDAFDAMIEEAIANCGPPSMSFHVSVDGRAVELLLDTGHSTYTEWIKGEGADIGLVRDQETKRVMGVRLPLYNRRLVIGGDGIPTQVFEIKREEE